MDITELFKGCVKIVRTRNKAFGVPEAQPDKNRIIARRGKNVFILQAKEITTQITRLRDFLLENRKAYIYFGSHLTNLVLMTDGERDLIDAAAQKIINACINSLSNFKRKYVKDRYNPQLQEHVECLFELIEIYLKSVCKIYSEQKAIRVKRSLEIRTLSKLEFDKKPQTMPYQIEKKSVLDSNLKSKIQEINHSEVTSGNDDDQISAEDLQMFESENAQLYNDLNNLTDEVQQIESKVVHIAELQEIFTEKVLQQDQDIDRIASTVVGSTENVRDANDQIRQAIQRNAGLRVWVLFFLLVMSFSLLFLDWYND